MRYLVVAAVLLLFFARAIASYIIDFEWWREMGQVETWISMLLYGVTPGILASVIAFAAFWIAHARGMKVYLDIITNHTADVIRYRECAQSPCAYRSIADYPYTRRGGSHGAPINAGFEGDDAKHQTQANFARFTSPDYAYTPYVPDAEKTASWAPAVAASRTEAV